MKFREDNQMPATNGVGNFVKLQDKESVVGVFMGDIQEVFVVWKDRKPMEVPEGTPNSSFRFRVNFITKEKESGVYVPKIFEQGITVYRQLADIHKECDLQKTVIKITRNGSGTDTTYSLVQLSSQKVGKEVTVVPLLPLESKQKATETEPQDDEIPF